MIPQLKFISQLLEINNLKKKLRTSRDVRAWQAGQLLKLQKMISHTFPAFSNYYERNFAAWPYSDKATVMADFANYNRLGLSAEDGWAMFEGRSSAPHGYAVGASTGTSGNRGLYVVSDAERYQWLATILAKTLPRFPFETARIALILPLNSALYRAANLPGLALRFFDLHEGLDVLRPQIATYAPDTIVAPPKVLRDLADSDVVLNLKRVFSGAEVLDPLDRKVIEAKFDVTVREIYMATEGLLGVSCEYGTLHLCEDVTYFEWEKPFADSDLVTPVITDFTRTIQAMVRYRMNDLLSLSNRPCRCGSPYQAVASIEGRCDDVLSLRTHSHVVRSLTPDIIRNAIVDADRRIANFRVRQTGPRDLELALEPNLPKDAANKARDALGALLAHLDIAADIQLIFEIPEASARKVRRVENVWRG